MRQLLIAAVVCNLVTLALTDSDTLAVRDSARIEAVLCALCETDEQCEQACTVDPTWAAYAYDGLEQDIREVIKPRVGPEE